MTGTVLFQLVSQGILSLEDAVSSFRNDVPSGEKIRISQLLDMNSRLHTYSEDLPFNELLDAERQKVWQPEELVALGLAGHPTLHQAKVFTTPTQTPSSSP